MEARIADLQLICTAVTLVMFLAVAYFWVLTEPTRCNQCGTKNPDPDHRHDTW